MSAIPQICAAKFRQKKRPWYSRPIRLNKKRELYIYIKSSHSKKLLVLLEI